MTLAADRGQRVLEVRIPRYETLFQDSTVSMVWREVRPLQACSTHSSSLQDTVVRLVAVAVSGKRPDVDRLRP